MQQVVSPRVVGRTPSRGSHPEPWVAPRAVRGIGGGGRVVLRLELYRALQHVCVLAGGGGGGCCIAPQAVQGIAVWVWGGFALHPELCRVTVLYHRSCSTLLGWGLHCTPRCTEQFDVCMGGGGVFALHPKLYRTLQGEGELHCTLSHAGELRCTPGHAGYCLGGGGGDCTAPQAAQCTAAWVGVALRPEPCRALQGLGRGLALLQGCVGGRSSSGAAGEHTGPHTQRWAGGGEQRAWSGSSTAEEGTGRGNGAAPASARCSLMWVGEREREKEGRGKDKKGRREGGTEGRQGRQRMPSRWGLLWPATPGAGCPVNWDLVSPAKV